jgi:hypothetical protein
MSKADTNTNEDLVQHKGGSLYVLDYPGEEPAIVPMHGCRDDHRILVSAEPLRATTETAGFSVTHWTDMTEDRTRPCAWNPDTHRILFRPWEQLLGH